MLPRVEFKQLTGAFAHFGRRLCSSLGALSGELCLRRARLWLRAPARKLERDHERDVSLSVLGAVRACVYARRRFLFFRVRKGDGRYY